MRSTRVPEVLTFEEMKERYGGEWLLIADDELNDDLHVVRGRVVAHSPDRDEIYRRLLSVDERRLALEYAGEIPEDVAVML